MCVGAVVLLQLQSRRAEPCPVSDYDNGFSHGGVEPNAAIATTGNVTIAESTDGAPATDGMARAAASCGVIHGGDDGGDGGASYDVDADVGVDDAVTITVAGSTWRVVFSRVTERVTAKAEAEAEAAAASEASEVARESVVGRQRRDSARVAAHDLIAAQVAAHATTLTEWLIAHVVSVATATAGANTGGAATGDDACDDSVVIGAHTLFTDLIADDVVQVHRSSVG
jgi:hypothetical protein